MLKVLMFLFLSIYSVKSQNVLEKFEIVSYSLVQDYDTISYNNYDLTLLKDDSIGQFTEFEIVEINTDLTKSTQLVKDLLNQKVKLKLNRSNGTMTIDNYKQLSFSKGYWYYVYADCGSEGMEERLNHFINYDLSFLKLLPKNEDIKTLSETSKNGYSLKYVEGQLLNDNYKYKLNDISFENYCYDYYFCVVESKNKEFNLKVDSGKETYTYLKDKYEEQIKLLDESLADCLEQKEIKELEFTVEQDIAGVKSLKLSKDRVAFPRIYKHERANIIDVIEVSRITDK